MNREAVLLGMLLLIATPLQAQDSLLNRLLQVACYRYGKPEWVAGTLQRRTLPGPPNYDSVAAGDEPETGFYLDMPPWACVQQGSDSAHSLALPLVQLLLDSAGYARLRPLLERSIALHGSLSEPETGHHHAPLLMIDSVRVRCRGDESTAGDSVHTGPEPEDGC